ncbi:cell division protein FtsZ [Crassaminicella thermophila]|uniref:Cell division protein FtsZ n=1 Tax=Crassaminicella thermophila TaxID=2599308 RepID=A0A5C0SD15_CRATE|nr:cell division protein FtsZ [Crassaminicella thermophila]QEK12121.1 cell division protein FtsZ [Crassaminicella thermophila]
MEEKYAKTYKFGNTTVKIVAPPPKKKEEIEKILVEYHQAGWDIIEELLVNGENVDIVTSSIEESIEF